ncbi:hypothetical protein KIPB_009355, partial [Kipferlia bialata]
LGKDARASVARLIIERLQRYALDQTEGTRAAGSVLDKEMFTILDGCVKSAKKHIGPVVSLIRHILVPQGAGGRVSQFSGDATGQAEEQWTLHRTDPHMQRLHVQLISWLFPYIQAEGATDDVMAVIGVSSLLNPFLKSELPTLLPKGVRELCLALLKEAVVGTGKYVSPNTVKRTKPFSGFTNATELYSFCLVCVSLEYTYLDTRGLDTEPLTSGLTSALAGRMAEVGTSHAVLGRLLPHDTECALTQYRRHMHKVNQITASFADYCKSSDVSRGWPSPIDFDDLSSYMGPYVDMCVSGGHKSSVPSALGMIAGCYAQALAHFVEVSSAETQMFVRLQYTANLGALSLQGAAAAMEACEGSSSECASEGIQWINALFTKAGSAVSFGDIDSEACLGDIHRAGIYKVSAPKCRALLSALEASPSPVTPVAAYVLLTIVHTDSQHRVTPATFLQYMFQFCTPFVVTALVNYVNDTSDAPTETQMYYWVAAAFLVPILTNISSRIAEYFGYVVNAACQGGVTDMVYKKLLTLSEVTRQKVSSGNVLNLALNDSSRAAFLFQRLNNYWAVPLTLVVGFTLLIQALGVFGLCGLLAMCVILPCQMMVMRLMMRSRVKLIKASDDRVGRLTEILSGIKVVKMGASEDIMELRVANA